MTPMRTLLALLLAASTASALGSAPLPPLQALSLQGVRVAAADAPGVGPGAVAGTQSSWQDLVRFSDGPNPSPYARGIAPKAWTAAEKQLVLGHLAWVVQTHPGLWQRAAAAGPLTLYRTASMGTKLILTLHTTMTFADSGLVDGPRTRPLQFSTRFNVVHELAHVADIEANISSKPGWRAAVEGKLCSYHAQAPALSPADRTPLAVGLGLGSAYAAHNQAEALAESAAFAAMEPLMSAADFAALRLNPAVLDFVRREVLAAPSAPSSVGRDLYEAVSARDGGRRADAYTAFTRALQADPDALTAYIQRAQLSLADPALPRTAAADLAAARPLLFDHHQYALMFYETAATEAALANRHADVLSDCAAAGAKGLESGGLLYYCGRSRMMDSRARGMRRQITPDERERGYARAIEELRRAKALAPHLAPHIDPVEKQIEGLLAPKPPAA